VDRSVTIREKYALRMIDNKMVHRTKADKVTGWSTV